MDTCPIVAIAFSAGDSEAICELLSALRSDCGVALIVVQQSDAAHEVRLVGVLAERTSLAVLRAEDGTMPQQDHVYVVSAGQTLTLVRGEIRVTSKAGDDQSHPADLLLTSLAKTKGDRAIGVVLSGAGTDGALGIRAIEQRGGTTFAQYPGSARYPSMPITAIETGCVGAVMRPNEIARELTGLGRRAACPASVPRPLLFSESDADADAQLGCGVAERADSIHRPPSPSTRLF